jgi:ribosomal protein L16 Arg81 hydroxylase
VVFCCFSKISTTEYIEKFPNLVNLKGYEVVLEPGETLYMPSGYWHYINYIDSSFSVALRSLPNKFNYILASVNNVFLVRQLNKLFDYSPSLKKVYDNLKINTMKKRYADHKIEL